MHLHMTRSYTASLYALFAPPPLCKLDPGRTHMSLYPCRCVCPHYREGAMVHGLRSGAPPPIPAPPSPAIFIRFNLSP